MIIHQVQLINYLQMKTVSICKSVYPDGRIYEYKNGAFLSKIKAPNTKEFNKWIKYIYKLKK
jgi:hypothetical protein